LGEGVNHIVKKGEVQIVQAVQSPGSSPGSVENVLHQKSGSICSNRFATGFFYFKVSIRGHSWKVCQGHLTTGPVGPQRRGLFLPISTGAVTVSKRPIGQSLDCFMFITVRSLPMSGRMRCLGR